MMYSFAIALQKLEASVTKASQDRDAKSKQVTERQFESAVRHLLNTAPKHNPAKKSKQTRHRARAVTAAAREKNT
jgi:hypothetical protein